MSDTEIHFSQFEEDNFVAIPNETIRNTKLSWAAKGLLAYLLSHSKNWKIKTSQLYSFYDGSAKHGNGEDAIKKLLKELKDLKYIVYKKSHDKKGLWKHQYYLFKKPCTPEQFKIIYPEGEFPPVVKPPVVNPPITEYYITEKQDDDDEPAEAGNCGTMTKMIVFRHKTKNIVSKREAAIYEYLISKGYFESEIKTALAEADDCNPVLKADNHNVIERYLMAMIDKQREKTIREKKINDSKQRTQTRTHNSQQDLIQRSREGFRKEINHYGCDAR